MRIMRSVPTILLALAAMAAAAMVPTARAAEPEFGLSIGYSNLSLGGNDALDGQGGARFEPRMSFAPFDDHPQMRFGFAFAFSYFYDESDAGQIVSPPFSFDVDQYQDVFLMTLEFQASWRQPLGEHWWIEGGVGVGPAFGYLSAGDVVFDELVDEDVSEDEFGLGLRPFIRAAYHGDHWSWGLETSYMWTTFDFGGPLGGDEVEEWYVGFFFGFSP